MAHSGNQKQRTCQWCQHEWWWWQQWQWRWQNWQPQQVRVLSTGSFDLAGVLEEDPGHVDETTDSDDSESSAPSHDGDDDEDEEDGAGGGAPPPATRGSAPSRGTRAPREKKRDTKKTEKSGENPE